MGFFDRFNKSNKNVIQNNTNLPHKRNEIQYSYTQDGRLVVELIERETDLDQFYDTTKLVIDNVMVDLYGEYVQNCMISWYGQQDCVRLDSKGNDMGRRGAFKNVLAQIDIGLLQNDEEYALMLMKGLMNQKRVEQYLQNGLEEAPNRPCGNYIGGVRQSRNGYEKFFNLNLGEAAHNMPQMIQRRQRFKERAQQAKLRAIAEKQAQISRLQQDIDELER